ncbi:MAG: FAD-binding oxidoreductase [Alphaproteobacteria bacterium]
MVGLATAIHLQRRGFAVTLVDRGPPGGETSFGNAGVIGRGSILPVATPGVRRKAWRYLLNRDPAVRVDHAALPALLPWLRRFLACADARTMTRNAAPLNTLCAAALAAHEDLIAEAGAGGLLRRNGYLTAYRTAARFAADAPARAILAAHGVAMDLLDAADVAAIEPHLAPVFRHAVLAVGSASVSDPGALCAAYHRLYLARGGTGLRFTVQALLPAGDGWRVATDGPTLVADRVVVALGPWSADLLRPLGLRLPLGVERGYHTHRRPLGNAVLGRPVFDAESGYVLAPMDAGIRITSGTELARRDAPSTPRQLARVLPVAHATFPMEQRALADGDVWRGARPSFPDSLPVIGPAPGRPGLWLAFGHGHIGFSTGPATGRAVAAAIAGAAPEFDLAPFSAARWL